METRARYNIPVKVLLTFLNRKGQFWRNNFLVFPLECDSSDGPGPGWKRSSAMFLAMTEEIALSSHSTVCHIRKVFWPWYKALRADLLHKRKIFETFVLSNIWNIWKGEKFLIAQFHPQIFHCYDYYIVQWLKTSFTMYNCIAHHQLK